MSITYTEIDDGRGSSQGSDWKRTYTRSWRAITNSATVGSLAVRSGCPVSLGNTYDDGTDSDTGAFVNNIEARSEGAGDGKSWIVTVTYGPYDPEVQPQSPLERPLKVNWGNAVYQKNADFDIDGDPILNSAEESFLDPIDVDDSQPVLTIVRAEETFDVDRAYQYRRAINSDIFLGADPGKIKLAPITAELARDQDIGWYWMVTYEFFYNPDGWVKKVLDQGKTELYDDSGTTKRRPIYVDGVAVAEPVLLDGAGAKLAPGDDPVFLEFDIYDSLPFSVFGLTESDIPALA